MLDHLNELGSYWIVLGIHERSSRWVQETKVKVFNHLL